MCEQFIEIGRLVNREKEADKIIETTKTEVERIRQAVEKFSIPKVFVQIGAKPLFTANKNSFINDYIQFAGGLNIAAESKTGNYSREMVIKANPDIIIITTMGIAGDKERKIWERYKTIKAVKDKKISIIDSYFICSPTPKIFAETLAKIAKIFHGEKIK